MSVLVAGQPGRDICSAASSVSVLGADPVTCISSSRGFLSVLLLKVLEMKDFVGFYLEEALEYNVQPINCLEASKLYLPFLPG